MVTPVGRFVHWLAGVVLAGTCLASLIAAPDTVTYRGMCDASAGVPLDPVFFVAANDEDNVLRIYSREDPGRPSVVVNLNKFLRLSKGSRETDIEGGAWIEGRIYWITSHGRNAEGKPAANRRRFFATTVRRAAGSPVIVDLDGLGIRDLLWRDGRYLVIAGAHDGAGAMRLYEWDGTAAAPRWLQAADFGDTTPEALLAFPGDDLGRLLVLSDDGTWPVGCTECKKLKDSNLKQFRALLLIP